MTTGERPWFRPEAVAHHARGRSERRVLDLGERRTTQAFRGLVAVIVLAVVVGLTVRADVSAEGTATVRTDGRSATLLLPVGALRRLRPGLAVRLRVGGHDVRGEVREVGVPTAGATEVVVPAVADIDGPQTAGAQGKAVVRLAHPTLAALLLGRSRG